MLDLVYWLFLTSLDILQIPNLGLAQIVKKSLSGSEQMTLELAAIVLGTTLPRVPFSAKPYTYCRTTKQN